MSQNGKDVLIRIFKKSDLDNLLEVAKKSFAEEFETNGFDPDHIREMADKAFSFLGKLLLGFLRLLGKEPFRLFVAEADGRVAGTTMVSIRGTIGYVAAVMVHPTYRRKGMATKLVKTALDYIQKKKLRRAILHVVSKNTPAKSMYHKLGFRKFENITHLIANTDSLQKPQNVDGVLIRTFKKEDTENVYDLIKLSEDQTHLKIYGFKKKDLEISFLKRMFPSSTDKRLVALKNGRIIGYVEASYTTAEEAGLIRNIQFDPNVETKGIEEALVYEGVKHVKKARTKKVMATVLSRRRRLIEKMEQTGFTKSLEMEGMVLEFKN